MATLQLLVAGHVPLSLAGLNGIDLDFRSDGAMSPTPHYEMSQSLDSCVQDAQHIVRLRTESGAILEVTDSHRVPTFRNEMAQTVTAGMLLVGDTVRCTSNRTEKLMAGVVRVSLAFLRVHHRCNDVVSHGSCVVETHKESSRWPGIVRDNTPRRRQRRWQRSYF